MIPTDEEIEKAAGDPSQAVDPEWYGFVAGAKWMRERCGIQWKKPSEEMPEEGRPVIFFSKLCGLETAFLSKKDNTFNTASSSYDAGKVLAWASIELPDWLK